MAERDEATEYSQVHQSGEQYLDVLSKSNSGNALHSILLIAL